MANFKIRNSESLPQNKEYQKKFFEVLQSLEEYEEICPKCCASGVESSVNFGGKTFCKKCNGKGKILWIDKIMRKGE